MKLRQLSLLLWLALTAPLTVAEPQNLDSLVAVVNKEAITSLELKRRINLSLYRLNQAKIPLPPQGILEQQILEQFILERAQLQYAKTAGITVDDLELSRIMGQLAKDRGIPVTQLQEKMVQNEPITAEEFRTFLRTEIILSRLRSQNIDSRINVSEGDITRAIADAKTSNTHGNDEVELAQIMLRVPEQSTTEQVAKIRAKAEDLEKQLRTGADFSTLAAGQSNAPEALKGGHLGVGRLNSWPAIFVEALKNMNTGDISAVLRSPAGFHILKLLQRNGSVVGGTYKQTKARHILLLARADRTSEQAQALAQDIKKRLDAGSNFAELARQYSDDSTAVGGGELGWLVDDGNDPLSIIMSKQKIGEVVGPVATPAGWQIIQVEERRDMPLSDAQQREQISNSLRSAKSKENYDEWLRQLRSRTYVEYLNKT